MISYQTQGAVAVITLRRPEKRNALDASMRAGLRDAFDTFEADENLQCAVLAAEGTTFCAGADLNEMASNELGLVPAEMTTLHGTRELTKITIAAVNGPALAGGFYLAQGCDLCVASRKAAFGIPEARRGRGAHWAVPLAAMLPSRIMLELLVTGEPISASRAYDLGLVNRIVDDDPLPAALELAHQIAANAPLSVRAGKRLTLLAADLGPALAREPARWLYEHVYLSEDGREGPRAFAEKRAPRWVGR